ncbi:esterase [Dactylonectria macrodidyma]|uniref:Esterase n=1 Tax=Dactylonectria macrodidyma TaxID=307937 RepID=A0A9P9DN48_9HYPO|nr:esterase [Dactylonectria macrodidyma]
MSLPQIAKLVCFFAVLSVDIGVHLTLAVIRSTFPGGKPWPAWSLQQTLRIRMTKSLLRWVSTLRLVDPLSLEAGSEGDRFCLLPPAARRFYVGPMQDPDVRPQTIGGTWTPESPRNYVSGRQNELKVVLHFHGGAYVIGNGRDSDTGYLAENYLKYGGFTHVFTPQYRLATAPQGRFPAALQDSLSAYMYLVNTLKISPKQIVVGGDSAGGNIVMALLRYIFDHGEELGIPWPTAVLLWSPWTSITASTNVKNIRASPSYPTDYIHENFPLWGVHGLTGDGRISPRNPYLSHGDGHGFKSPAPIWVNTGKLEVLYNDNSGFVDTFRRAGTEIDWDVDENCPHDIGLMGQKLKFEKEAVAATKRAGKFVARHCF